MISVVHLTRRFGDFTALDDLSFEIAPGEVVGFLGPNGAGKTTTLRVIAGYLPATSGSVRVAGFDVSRDSLEVRRRIGYLPESVPLYLEHRVIEMLEFQARLRSMPRARAKQRIPAVLERVGIADRSRDLIRHLSRGLRQRVGIAVALLAEPEVLILDEPTSGLDPLQRMEVRSLIQDLAEKHTVLLSSHILPEIEAVCPRVIIVHRGRIAADARADDLVRTLGRDVHVRLEARIGPDVAHAMRLLGSLAGVQSVEDRGRVGIYHALDIRCAEDLREDVGALAAQRGWAIRELSWKRPTLEDVFARIALGIEDEAPSTGAASVARAEPTHGTIGAPSSARELAQHPSAGEVLVSLGGAGATGTARDENRAPAGGAGGDARAAEPPRAEAARKVVYNLNPFDQGATRDLGRPKAIEPPLAIDLPAPVAPEAGPKAPREGDPPSHAAR